MNTLIKRFAAAFLFSATILVSAPALASASTGPWSWTDISNQLTVRTNRPVWAMAYANGNWFYTDGQDLWNGGQVYRFDGATKVNITLNVRNAGLSRVDDIVSDGQSVLFLKGIVARNNQFEIISYANGSYSSLTSDLRKRFQSDEGLVSVVGKNGTWGIVTSRGRVVLYTPNSTLRIVRDYPTYYQQIPYIMNHVSSGTGQVHLYMALQPVNNGWLLTRYVQGTRFELIDMNGNATRLFDAPVMDYVDTMVSNGNTVLIGGTHISAGLIVSVFDGSKFRDVSSPARLLPSNFNPWNDMLAVWDGTSWMLLRDKEVARFDGTSFQSYGKTNDYFVTGASNGFGTILLGGAVSNANTNQPTLPLTAKLVKVVNDGGTSTAVPPTPTTNTQTSNGISSWAWLEPSKTTINRDQTTTYNVGAWSANGLKRIELFSNGISRRVCDFGKAYGNQNCTVTLYGSDYTPNTQVAVNAKITDGKDKVAWVPVQNLTVTDTNGDVSVWTWLDPSNSTLNRNASAAFRVQSSATQGLSRIEVYNNGILRRTCYFSRAYGTQNCDLSIYGGAYTAGSQLSLNAKATDYNGKATWSDNKYVNIVDYGTTPASSNQSNGDTQSWVWSTPETNVLSTDTNVTFNVGANDPNGVRRIEFFVNGYQVSRVCDTGSPIYGNTACSYQTYGGAYPSGSTLAISARITDGYGNVAWSNARIYSIVSGSGSTNTSNTNASTWIWSVPETSVLKSGESTVFRIGAWDNDGIQRIDVWINGQVKQTCNLGNAYGNQECGITVNANDYPAGSSVFVNASVIDGKGQVAWSGSRTYAIQTSNVTSTGSTGFPENLPGNISVSSDRDSGFTGTDTVTVTATANDKNGIRRIDLLVNGAIVKTCDGQSSCSFTGGPYPTSASLAYGANLVDNNGYALWTGYKTIYKK